MTTDKLTQVPIICAECGAYLGAYMGHSPEPVNNGCVLRFCPLETRNTVCSRDEGGLSVPEQRVIPLKEKPTYF